VAALVVTWAEFTLAPSIRVVCPEAISSRCAGVSEASILLPDAALYVAMAGGTMEAVARCALRLNELLP
jgi:hypothetical protein